MQAGGGPGSEASSRGATQGSDETRRAMVKSFQTSGGTVLSTNWDVSQVIPPERATPLSSATRRGKQVLGVALVSRFGWRSYSGGKNRSTTANATPTHTALQSV